MTLNGDAIRSRLSSVKTGIVRREIEFLCRRAVGGDLQPFGLVALAFGTPGRFFLPRNGRELETARSADVRLLQHGITPVVSLYFHCVSIPFLLVNPMGKGENPRKRKGIPPFALLSHRDGADRKTHNVLHLFTCGPVCPRPSRPKHRLPGRRGGECGARDRCDLARLMQQAGNEKEESRWKVWQRG